LPDRLAGGAESAARVALLHRVRYMAAVIRELTARDEDGDRAAVNVTSLALSALKTLVLDSRLKVRCARVRAVCLVFRF